MIVYTVKPGDYLVKIAAEHGTTWQAIWDHPGNAELRSSRSSADDLRPGDILVIDAPAPDEPVQPPPPLPVTPAPPGSDVPSGLPWPYPTPEPLRPTWDCPGGTCVCHPVDENAERVKHTVILYDEHAVRMPLARVRVFESGRRLAPEHADVTGAVELMLLPSTKTLELEWAPAALPLRMQLPYRKHYYVDLTEDSTRAALRRLANLGFDRGRSSEQRVRHYQHAFHENETGRLSDIEAEVKLRHDHGQVPPIVPTPSSGSGFSSFAETANGGPELESHANERFAGFAEDGDGAGSSPTGGAAGGSQGAAVPPHGHVEVLVQSKDHPGTPPANVQVVARNQATGQEVQPSLPLEPLHGFIWASFYFLPAGTWEIVATAPFEEGRRTVTVTNGSYDWIDVVLAALPRRRLSIFDFTSGFWVSPGAPDTPALDKLQAGRLDDYTLVHVIHPGPGGSVVFDPRFKIFGSIPSQADREKYFNDLAPELHKRGVQFLAGYALADTADHATARGEFFALVTNTSPPKPLPDPQKKRIADHADQIVAFLNKFHFDGIAFDIEIGSLKDDVHGDGARLLITKVAKKMPIVTYFTAAFLGPATGNIAHMAAFPYAFSKTQPNLVALPMCFDAGGKKGVGPFSKNTIVKTVDLALKGTSGSHVQVAVRNRHSPEDDKNTGVTDFDAVAVEMERRGVGMALMGTRNNMFARAQKLDAVLSSGARGPGKAGNPQHAKLPKDLI